jgi:hypothetical protein
MSGSATAGSATVGSASAGSANAAGGVDTTKDSVLASMVGFKDRMCACKDEACVDGVKDDMNRFANKQAIDPIVEPATTTEAHGQAMVRVAQELTACTTKAMNH